jgi:hypothetical protein
MTFVTIKMYNKKVKPFVKNNKRGSNDVKIFLYFCISRILYKQEGSYILLSQKILTNERPNKKIH